MKTAETDWTAPFHLGGDRDESVVLIHGYTGHPGHWRPLAERLHAGGYTVIAPVLAGHSGSPEEMAAAGWRHWAASAEKAADAVAGHRHVHLVGLSLGGLLAILLAAKTAARSVVTINSPVLLYETRAYASPIARYFVDTLPAAIGEVPDPELAHLWREHPDHSVAAVANLVQVVARAYSTAGSLRRPSLVVQSRTDDVVRPISGRLLGRRLRARLHWVDTHHNALLDLNRETVYDAVIEHLAAGQ